jgi:hypothetical protein
MDTDKHGFFAAALNERRFLPPVYGGHKPPLQESGQHIDSYQCLSVSICG